MAISYSKVNWDTSKYVNPTNMNQMDNGIKAACDGVDALDTEMGTTDISSVGDGTITGAIGNINTRMAAKPTILNFSQAFTSSSTLTYTGFSVTIPAGKCYGIQFGLVYANNAPQEILISLSSTSTASYLTVAKGDGSASISGYATAETTYYIWARYNGAGANGVEYKGWYM